MIAARRPNSPLISGSGRRSVAASAAPGHGNGNGNGNGTPQVALAEPLVVEAPKRAEAGCGQRRAARIVPLGRGETDERERNRLRLLDRLMHSETRGAISRAANEYLEAGFEFPQEQAVQLQLLEHFDESRARDAVEALARLLQEEAPTKVPILTQRLRRLEEYADEAQSREAAAELRRSLRS
jgi:hypothetical protein